MNELSVEMLEMLLGALGTNGVLDETLDSADIDLILGSASTVRLSEAFEQRAVKAISDGQASRVAAKPLLVVSTLIRTNRLLSGLSLEEVASASNIHMTQLSQIEAGRYTLQQFMQLFPAARLIKLLHVVHVKVADFADKLMDAASLSETKFSMARSAQSNKRNQTSGLRSVVASFILELEQLDHSN